MSQLTDVLDLYPAEVQYIDRKYSRRARGTLLRDMESWRAMIVLRTCIVEDRKAHQQDANLDDIHLMSLHELLQVVRDYLPIRMTESDITKMQWFGSHCRDVRYLHGPNLKISLGNDATLCHILVSGHNECIDLLGKEILRLNALLKEQA